MHPNSAACHWKQQDQLAYVLSIKGYMSQNLISHTSDEIESKWLFADSMWRGGLEHETMLRMVLWNFLIF